MKRGNSTLIATLLLVAITLVVGSVIAITNIELVNDLIQGINTDPKIIKQQEVPFSPLEIKERQYIYDSSGVIAIKEDSNLNYVTKDYLGNTRIITNNNKQITYSQDYYPFGLELKQNNIQENSYSGKEFDEELGLYYYGARYYNPSLGRFTQIDPLQSSNSPYEAFNNNPNMFIDPDGRESKPSIVNAYANYLENTGITSKEFKSEMFFGSDEYLLYKAQTTRTNPVADIPEILDWNIDDLVSFGTTKAGKIGISLAFSGIFGKFGKESIEKVFGGKFKITPELNRQFNSVEQRANFEKVMENLASGDLVELKLRVNPVYNANYKLYGPSEQHVYSITSLYGTPGLSISKADRLAVGNFVDKESGEMAIIINRIAYTKKGMTIFENNIPIHEDIKINPTQLKGYQYRKK